jgi:hypothetical protein
MANTIDPPCVIEKTQASEVSGNTYTVTFNGLTGLELLGLRTALKQLAEAGSEHAQGMLDNLTAAAEEGNLKVTIFRQES